MLAYLTIFIASVCGYAGAPLWSPLLGAVGLLSISFAQHHGIVKRGMARDFQDEVDDAFWRSALNAVATTSSIYVFGMVVRALH